MGKGSEYQHRYRSKWEEHADTYVNNVDYRSYRRLREHEHHLNAFAWNSPEWYETDSINSGKLKPNNGLPIHQYKHLKFNDAYHRNISLNCKGKRIDHAVQVNGIITPKSPDQQIKQLPLVASPISMNHATQTEKTTANRVPKKDMRNIQVQVKPNGAIVVDDVSRPSTAKPRKPAQSPNIKYAESRYLRPKSAPSGPQPSKQIKITKGPAGAPFIAFGYCDKEREIGTKRTHNIRASAEIYPAALRAQRRLEIEMQRQKEEAEDIPSYEKRKHALFNFKSKSDDWETEYSDNFVGYDDQYEKNLSARLNPLKHPSYYFIPA